MKINKTQLLWAEKGHNALLYFFALHISEECRLKCVKPCRGFVAPAAGTYGASQNIESMMVF